MPKAKPSSRCTYSRDKGEQLIMIANYRSTTIEGLLRRLTYNVPTSMSDDASGSEVSNLDVRRCMAARCDLNC